MYPSTSDRNFTPTSTADESAIDAFAGVADGVQIEQGQWTCASTPGPGLSMFPLSSTARLSIVTDPGVADGVQA
jgi:hypothetical protein